MPTQAQRQRDWEFLAELKPGDEAVGKARDRLVLASLLPEGSGSGNSPWSPQGRTEEAAAFGQPGSGASWGLLGAAEPANGRANGGASALGGSNGVQLVAERPTGSTASAQGQAQRGGAGGA